MIILEDTDHPILSKKVEVDYFPWTDSKAATLKYNFFNCVELRPYY